MNRSIVASIPLVFALCANHNLSAQSPEEILAREGIMLPAIPASIGTYTSLVRSGNLIYLSGRGPLLTDGSYVTGKLGKDMDARQGADAARLCAIAQIAVLKAELETLSRISRIVKLTVFVNCTDNFTDQPEVANGCSDLMVTVFGAKGIHARSATGVASLPGGWPVEVEMIIEVQP